MNAAHTKCCLSLNRSSGAAMSRSIRSISRADTDTVIRSVSRFSLVSSISLLQTAPPRESSTNRLPSPRPRGAAPAIQAPPPEGLEDDRGLEVRRNCKQNFAAEQCPAVEAGDAAFQDGR